MVERIRKKLIEYLEEYEEEEGRIGRELFNELKVKRLNEKSPEPLTTRWVLLCRFLNDIRSTLDVVYKVQQDD